MKKFMYGLAAMSLAVAFTGCDDDGEKPDPGNEGECFLDSECGGYACDIADAEGDDPGVCLTECIQQADCAEGYECDASGECVAEGDGGKIYNKVVIVSRTSATKEDGDACRAPTPGPDIDYVRGEKNGEVVPATTASGQHGGKCTDTSTEVTKWAEPGVVLEQLSIGLNESGQEEEGWCAVNDSHEKFFFMGTGQNYVPGETIAEGTGVLLVELAGALEDGDLIEVGEVGIEPGSDGEGQTCDHGPKTPYPGDIFSIYIASSDVDSVGVGTVLEAPDFILVKETAIGLTKATVVLD